MKEIRTDRLTIVPFELKYLDDYYNGFDKEITKYQYPDSFDSVEVARACLKNHFRHLHAPLCVIFAPHSVDVARYASFIWHKSLTNCGAHLTESIFQTRSRTLLQEFIDDMNRGEMLFLAILDQKGAFAGGLEVHGLAEEYPELGIWLKKDFQGKGYAYEALCSVLQYLNQTCQKEWYVYEADIRNKPSIGLAAKFSYRKEGIDEFTTESGKELKLQRYLINIK